MNQDTEQNTEKTIRVYVTTDASGGSEVRFGFPDRSASDDAEEAGASGEDEQNKRAAEKFARKSLSEEEALRKFRQLNYEWKLVALGFFEIVPELSRRNVEYAGSERTSIILELLRQTSIASDETELDDGRVDREFSVTFEDFSIIAKALGRSRPSIRAARIMARSSLLALVSEYENFMSEMLRTLVRLKPNTLISDDETVTVRSLEQFASYDEFMEDLVDSKVTDLIQANSHFKLIRWIEEKFGVNLTSDKQMIGEFVEVFQRRHLLAHAGGVVNRKYLKVCTEHGCTEKTLPSLDERINVDRRYLRRATARVFMMGYFTLHILWQKVLPKQRDDSVRAILGASHDFLERDLTKMCERLCDFVLNSSKPVSARDTAYLAINKAQSYLFDPEAEEAHRLQRVEGVLRKYDWTMADAIVELALCCLRRDFSSLDSKVQRAVASGLTRHDAMTWSIFREVRQQEAFSKHFGIRALPVS